MRGITYPFLIRVVRYPHLDKSFRFRLRKVRIQIGHPKTGALIDESLMFAGPWFAGRLQRRIDQACRRAKIMLDASMDPLPSAKPQARESDK